MGSITTTASRGRGGGPTANRLPENHDLGRDEAGAFPDLDRQEIVEHIDAQLQSLPDDALLEVRDYINFKAARAARRRDRERWDENEKATGSSGPHDTRGASGDLTWLGRALSRSTE